MNEMLFSKMYRSVASWMAGLWKSVAVLWKHAILASISQSGIVLLIKNGFHFPEWKIV